MPPINRREAIFAGALGSAAAFGAPLTAGINAISPHQLQQSSASKRRTLTVVEMKAEELAELERLRGEINEAGMRFEAYNRALCEQYRAHVGYVANDGEDYAVSVEFQEGYAFIRDHRYLISEKEAALAQCENSAMAYEQRKRRY